MVKIQINLTNKWLYFLVGVMIISILGVGVWAYNAAGTGGNPSIMGHSGDEIGFGNYNLSENGYQKLPSGLIIQWGYIQSTSN